MPEWMNNEGEFGEGTPENVQNLLTAKKWTNVSQIVDGYAELEKFTAGAGKHLAIPQSDGDTEGWSKVWEQLGRPKTYSDYVIDNDETVPLDAEIASKWKQYAHKEGYTQNQMQGAVTFQREIIKSVMEAEAKNAEQSIINSKAAQKKELTEAFGEANYVTKVTGARVIADNLGIYNTLEKKGLASDPEVIKMLDKLKESGAEGVISSTPPPPPAKAPEVERDELNKSKAYTDEMHPEHIETVNRINELSRVIVNKPGYKRPGR